MPSVELGKWHYLRTTVPAFKFNILIDNSFQDLAIPYYSIEIALYCMQEMSAKMKLLIILALMSSIKLSGTNITKAGKVEPRDEV